MSCALDQTSKLHTGHSATTLGTATYMEFAIVTRRQSPVKQAGCFSLGQDTVADVGSPCAIGVNVREVLLKGSAASS